MTSIRQTDRQTYQKLVTDRQTDRQLDQKSQSHTINKYFLCDTKYIEI